MRIELSWPRSDAADRTLTVPVPDVPELLRPAAQQVRRLCGAGAVRRVVACAAPVVGDAASGAGGGVLVQLALPFAARLVEQSLECAEPAAVPAQRRRAR